MNNIPDNGVIFNYILKIQKCVLLKTWELVVMQNIYLICWSVLDKTDYKYLY